MLAAPAVQGILQHILAAVVGQYLLHCRSHAAHHAARSAECAVGVEVIGTSVVVGCFLMTHSGQQRLHGLPTAARRRIDRTACGRMPKHGFQGERQVFAVRHSSVAQHLRFCFGRGYQHKTATLGKQKGAGCFATQAQMASKGRSRGWRVMLHKPSLCFASCVSFAHGLCRSGGNYAAEYAYYI